MVRTPLFQPPTHAPHLYLESALAQALLELSVLSGRPDSQHPLHLERRVDSGNSAVVIKPCVVRGGHCRRAVVHIQQHGIELAKARTEYRPNVSCLHSHALVLQRLSRQRPERAMIPLHDCGRQLGHYNGRTRLKQIERRAQREALSQAADQYARPLELPHPLGRQRRHRLFRAVHPAGHKDRAVSQYEVFVAATNQLQNRAVRRRCLAQQLNRLHEGDVTGQENLSKNGTLTTA